MADKVLTGTPQIAFRHGTQSNLNKLRTDKSATAGTFYLTNDTHRLYVGVGDGDAVPVNEGITLMTSSEFANINNSNKADVNSAGQFVYITDKNILAVSAGINGWVQINSVKDTTYEMTGIVDGPENAVSVTFTIDGTDSSSSSGTFKLMGANGVVIAETKDNEITVYGTKITSKVNDNNSATIELKDKNGKVDSDIDIKGGPNVTISGSDDIITISAKDTLLDGEMSHSGYGDSNKGFKIWAANEGASEDSKVISGGVINPKIKVGSATAKQKTVEFISGTATLPVYTKDEIDEKYLQFNAMTYKGVIENMTTLPTVGTAQASGIFKDGIHNGDTFVAGKDLVSPAAKKGDLVIATGEEGTDGLLKTVTWQVVESGNEDTKYEFIIDPLNAPNTLTINEKPLGTNGEKVASLKIVGSGKIDVTQNDSEENLELTVTHKTVDVSKNPSTVTATKKDYATQTYGYDTFLEADFLQHTNVVQAAKAANVTVDTTGHVTKIQDNRWDVKDTNAVLATPSVEASVTGNVASVATTNTLIQSGGSKFERTSTFKLNAASPNVKFTKGTGDDTVDVGLIWGTF